MKIYASVVRKSHGQRGEIHGVDAAGLDRSSLQDILDGLRRICCMVRVDGKGKAYSESELINREDVQ